MATRIYQIGFFAAIVMFVAGCWVKAVEYREQARIERMERLLQHEEVVIDPR